MKRYISGQGQKAQQQVLLEMSSCLLICQGTLGGGGTTTSNIYLKDPTTKKFYRPNLIFWIVMGCGKARFSKKGQKNT